MRQDTVAIVTGGSFPGGRQVARGLAGWDWAIAVVYLEHQRAVEETIAQVLAAEGRIVAVRADIADDLDVRRLFAESSAAFGEVDVVAHTTTQPAGLLYRHTVRHLRIGGAIVSASAADGLAPDVERALRERGIGVGRAPPDGLLAFLDRWRRR